MGKVFSVEDRENAFRFILSAAGNCSRIVALVQVGSGAEGYRDDRSDLDFVIALDSDESMPEVMDYMHREIAGKYGVLFFRQDEPRHLQCYGDGDLDRFWSESPDRIYVAEDGQVVAFLSVEVHHDPVDHIYLDDFSVMAAYRNKGIGSALVRAAEAYAERIGSRAVLLHVEKTNTLAMRFYERSGYSVFRDDGNRFLLKKEMEDWNEVMIFTTNSRKSGYR